ncbi:MAG: efflux RND transporter periplasmic adaptor subunit [Thermoguttaceae bacterium]
MLKYISLFASIIILVFHVGCASKKQSGADAIPPAPDVVVKIVEQDDVQIYLYVDGRTEPYKFVDVRVRVPGYLEQLFFRSGAIVKEGAQLALIEPAYYKIALEAAKAQLTVSKERAGVAKLHLDRAAQLVESSAMTVEEYQNRLAEYQVAQANVALSETTVQKAELELTYTDICAPIPGKTTKNLIDTGNFINPNAGNNVLLSIAQMDPMYVDFFISDQQFTAIKEKLGYWKDYEKALGEEGVAPRDTIEGTNKAAKLTENIFDDHDFGAFDVSLTTGASVLGIDFPLSGKIVGLVDNMVNYETGQITLRGEVRNPILSVNGIQDYMIYPGQICRVRIPFEKLNNAILISEDAIQTDLDTKYVLVLKESEYTPLNQIGIPYKDEQGNIITQKGHVVYRRDIQIGRLLDSQKRVVTSGLQKGETYIALGVQRARIGSAVNPLTPEEYAKVKSPETGWNIPNEPQTIPGTDDVIGNNTDDTPIPAAVVAPDAPNATIKTDAGKTEAGKDK